VRQTARPIERNLSDDGYRLAAKNAVAPWVDATAAVLLLTVFHVLVLGGTSRIFLSKGRLCVSLMTYKWHLAMLPMHDFDGMAQRV
jgi:hypothetical protein